MIDDEARSMTAAELLLSGEAIVAKLREALIRLLGKEGEDMSPVFPLKSTERFRKIGREERPRLREYFGSLKESGAGRADLGRIARNVAHACEDAVVSLCAMEAKIDEAAPRSGIDAAAAKAALRRQPLVQSALRSAIELVERLAEFAAVAGHPPA